MWLSLLFDINVLELYSPEFLDLTDVDHKNIFNICYSFLYLSSFITVSAVLLWLRLAILDFTVLCPCPKWQRYRITPLYGICSSDCLSDSSRLVWQYHGLLTSVGSS